MISHKRLREKFTLQLLCNGCTVQMLLPNVSSIGILSYLVLAVEEKRVRLFQESFCGKVFGIKSRFEGKFLHVNILM